MLTDEQRIALLPKVMQKGKEPVTQVWLTQGDALSYSERIESAACADRDARIAELEQRNRDLHEDVQRFKEHALNEKDARMALERELAEVRKDAARYRWLRDETEWEPFDSAWLNRNDIYGCPTLAMDVAIDTAMKGTP